MADVWPGGWKEGRKRNEEEEEEPTTAGQTTWKLDGEKMSVILAQQKIIV